jgi:hypothetical protein
VELFASVIYVNPKGEFVTLPVLRVSPLFNAGLQSLYTKFGTVHPKCGMDIDNKRCKKI